MEIDKFKRLGLEELRSQRAGYLPLIEYRMEDPEHVRVTRLGYFTRLVEDLPPQFRGSETPEPPFAEIADALDKNGVPIDGRQIRLGDILDIQLLERLERN